MKKAGRFICAFAAFAVVIYLSLIHPLLFRNRFFDINTVKAYAFEAFALCAFALFVIGLIMRGFEMDSPVRADDFFLIVFVIVASVSTYLSPYSEEALTGEAGRSCGLLFITALAALYFVVSHTPRVRRMIYFCLTISGTLVSALAVMNFFGVDPLRFYTDFSEATHYMFISTVGNTSVFGSFLAVFLPLVFWRMYMSKSALGHALLSVCAFIGCCALIAARCDAAYIAVIVFFAFSLCLWDKVARGRIAEAAAILSISMVAMRLACGAYGHFGLEGSLSGAFLAFEYWYIPAAFFAVLAAIGFFLKSRRRLFSGKAFTFAFGVLLASAAALTVYYTFINTSAPLAKPLGVFRITALWGNSRGYIWDISLKLFKDAPLLQKLFGYGPDTLGLAASEKYIEVMLSSRGMIIDNAHNLPLQLLLTTGVTGLVSFAAFAFFAVKRMFADAKERPVMWGALICVVCYFAVSLVGVEQAVTTPLLFLMLAARRINHYDNDYRSSLK